MIRYVGFSTLPLLLAAPLAFANPAGAAGDYPTATIADYVLGCMQTNGQTRKALESCSCSIDVIASILPYDHYERAETFKSMSLTTGENAGLFRESAPAKAARTELKRAQSEADVRCF
ncbi:hypothetical protein EOD10_25825 [Mesorhizobium sp. M7A.T.Ca.TU.009.01.3.2]|jgi:hypothetical protein|uniref:hypothetical protein n=3 Tax=Phyllobacteriaceae TaxID=69277 RepID=UPI000FCBA030|nr:MULTISPECIES: hypothetical protein [Mesorhizobium]RUU09178.1 hypothetical protein EOD10_25825 [Mesorhizobium sp. M7A.T.Ca.TU.009.01.3.2]RUU61059.1 hypothetical protein EOC99_20735 [Mesorhizobium sp. M7A.T.Ca.TU.009.01.1.1]RUU83731.1 hypothetical protein EOD03_14460 [Mesorhizobium sp. M7A.T.Ca.TU.009.01.1.2]RUV05797.1 hypothetical protein EOD00_21035 [Mesorhizobium sp. M7A.T.Ca.TU.009.01.3.1]RUV49169.1 hypothetical protein EOB77_20725 [Mesorhizobium sp. M7A.F.Ca.MR.228.00.0.0]RVB39775.1 hyp